MLTTCGRYLDMAESEQKSPSGLRPKISHQGRGSTGINQRDFLDVFHVGNSKCLGLLFVLLACSAVTVKANQPSCIIKGHLYTQLPWYGYLVQKTFRTEMAKIQYQLSFPLKECCLNLLIYYDDQLRYLKEGMTCSEREAVLPPLNNQIIPLSVTNTSKGCVIRNDTDEPIVICVGERTFSSSGPRTWYFAVSKCNKGTPTSLWYYFNVTGYYGDCEADPLAKTYIPPPAEEDKYMYIAVALGVLAGLAFVVAIIFFGLWFMSRRQKEKKSAKGASGNDSVTSSQATMTQDIFYVNPSISDRDTSDYSRSSSENYYEVIPEGGRGYDAVDGHHLTVPHNGGTQNSRHMTVANMAKEYRSYHPPILDDYPPPPYPMHAIGKYPPPHQMAVNGHRHPAHHHHGQNHQHHHHAMETSA